MHIEIKLGAFAAALLIGANLYATNYYFDASVGNDHNNGTSIKSPFKSLEAITQINIKSGDKLLLKKGETFYGTLALKNIAGTVRQPILISAYGSAQKMPVIDAKGKLNGILIEDCSYVKVCDIEITANGGGLENLNPKQNYTRSGILLTTTKDGTYSGITLENLFIRDIFFEEPGYARTTAETLTGNGTQNYGWGIKVTSANTEAVLDNILISKCHVKNVSHSGIRFTGSFAVATKNAKNIRNVKVYDNIVEYSGGPAMQASVVENIEFKRNATDHSGSGDDSRKWARGSGLWVWGCYNAIIEHNSFRHANGPGDSAGCHIDFNNKNVIIQYNVSENNAGGFIEVLGNNYNCTYRYNVSINDGSRIHVEGKTLGAGTMMGVNGFVGFGKKAVGPFNLYIYNNTIFVKEGRNPEVGFASTVQGVLVANNIVCAKSGVTPDLRKNFLPQSGPIPNVIFKNNLYLSENNWPKASQVMITDIAPILGDPKFVNQGGVSIKDYIPQNAELIKNRGITIEKIPGDTIGLVGGLQVKRDILGRKITGLPDMGAIEMK